MIVKFKNSPSAKGFAYEAGQVCEVPEELGKIAIELGVADLIEEEKVERAVAPKPKEKAVKKRKKK